MSELTDLIVLPVEEKSQELFFIEGGTFDPELEKIREAAKDLPFDMNIKKNRDEIASFVYKIARSKTAIEKAGFAISAKYKEIPKKIDASRKKYKEVFEKLQAEVRKPLDDWDNAESARVEGIKQQLENIKLFALIDGLSSAGIRTQIINLEAIDCTQLHELESEALETKESILQQLEQSYSTRKHFEDQEAELLELREKAAIQDKKDQEERIAREATAAAQAAAAQEIANAKAALELAEKARLEKEAQDAADKIAAENQAIIDKKNAEEALRLAAENARLAEIERVEQEKLQQEKLRAERESDKNHKAKINRQIVNDLAEWAGLDENQAKKVVIAIAKSQISNIVINY